MPRMGMGCHGRTFEVRDEELAKIVEKILERGSKANKKGEIVIIFKGKKVGFIKKNVPLTELKTGSIWKSPMGIKVELLWKGIFVGALILRDVDEFKKALEA